jgi:hypothetical protein
MKYLERYSSARSLLAAVRTTNLVPDIGTLVSDEMKCFFAAPVARFMKFWNVPLLTAGGMVYDFSRRKTHAGAEFYLTTRVGFTFTGISRTLLKVFQR